MPYAYMNYYMSTMCLGIPDRLTIVSGSRGQYSDQFELRWTVRSASHLLQTLLRLKSVCCAPEGNGDTRLVVARESISRVTISLPKLWSP